jgi:hypothetical protein
MEEPQRTAKKEFTGRRVLRQAEGERKDKNDACFFCGLLRLF